MGVIFDAGLAGINEIQHIQVEHQLSQMSQKLDKDEAYLKQIGAIAAKNTDDVKVFLVRQQLQDCISQSAKFNPGFTDHLASCKGEQPGGGK